jgi:hypothetical protein
MLLILVEVVLGVALVVLLGTAARRFFQDFTPAGLRRRQLANRRAIDAAAEATCPIHGRQPEDTLVRLRDGSVMCPHCYQETVHGLVG